MFIYYYYYYYTYKQRYVFVIPINPLHSRVTSRASANSNYTYGSVLERVFEIISTIKKIYHFNNINNINNNNIDQWSYIHHRENLKTYLILGLQWSGTIVNNNELTNEYTEQIFSIIISFAFFLFSVMLWSTSPNWIN